MLLTVHPPPPPQLAGYPQLPQEVITVCNADQLLITDNKVLLNWISSTS